MKYLIVLAVFFTFFQKDGNAQSRIISGAERINVYLPLIKGRTVGILANPTSMVGNTHLVDTLLKTRH